MRLTPRSVALALTLVGLAGCKDFLDVNTNPNAPQEVSANLYLAPMLHWMATAPQYDGRFVARYTQQLMLPGTTSTPSTWDRMGYDPSSDNGGEMWRDVYWSLGQNLVDMNNKAAAEQRWDLLGVGQILKAWGWQSITDLHGEIIVKQAIDQSRFAFDYDTQEYAYQSVDSLLHEAIKNLKRTDGAVDQSYLAKGDRGIYGGDRTKWMKFAYGLLALSKGHYTNKSTYNPNLVIAYVDSSFTSNADDALFTYPNIDPTFADYNFLGTSRNNFTTYRQTQFVVNLMNGTDFGVVDPRMSRMLSPSPDGVFRGTDPNNGTGGAFTTTTLPNNPFGYVGTNRVGLPGRYVFDDKAKVPLMTYSQLQFVKAEAAFRKGDRTTALAAYQNGVSSHIDFVNARVNENANSALTPISAAEKSAFLANPAIVPTAANLNLTRIMTQKYIAQWAWGHNELWMDMRRYHYTDTDPATGAQVYPGFAIPTNLYPDNSGKPVYRIRPRYNSEYVWNRPALDAIGGLALDYHTKPTWIIQP